MRLKKILYATLSIALLAGCASSRYDAFYQKEFQSEFEKSVAIFCPLINQRTIIVSDLVRYSDLELTPVGLYLTEHLKVALTHRCNTKLYPIEMAKSIQVTIKGNRAFTREYEKLRLKNLHSNYLLTGTYALSQNYVTIFLKLINLKTSKLEKTTQLQTLYYLPNPLENLGYEEYDPFIPTLEE